VKARSILASSVVALLTLSACSSGSGSVDDPNNVAKPSGQLTASGSTFAQNFVQACAPTFAKASGISVTYAGGGSGKGRNDITNKTVDFAMSDSPFDASSMPEGIIHIPVIAGPLAIVYRLDGVAKLNLSETTLASIFTGKIKAWNDAAIAADNAGVTLPKRPIQVVYRQDSSGSTDVLTKYLKANAPSLWSSASGSDFAGTFPGSIPSNGSFQGASGSDAVTQKVKDTNGAITYAELSFAKERGLSTALVRNGSGEFVAASPATSSTFLAGASMDERGVIAIDYTAAVSGGYNLTAYTYALAYPDAKAGVAQFLTAMLEQCSGEADRLQYAPLSGSLQQQAVALIGRIGS
jgi:phosphate transport system substrate-binding protein